MHRHDGVLTISHFDSMNDSNSGPAKSLTRKVARLLGCPEYDYVAIKRQTQPNPYDCGVHVMACCDLFVASQFDHDAACATLECTFKISSPTIGVRTKDDEHF